MEEQFPGELETLRADNVRLRRLLELSEEQARAAHPDQAALTGAPTAPVDMRSVPEDKIRFYANLFRCRTESTPSVGRTGATADRVGCPPSKVSGAKG